MKIAVVSEAWFPLLGGGQQHAWNLSKELAENYNCKIDIYTRFFGKDRLGRKKGVKFYRVGPLSSFNNILARTWFIIITSFILFRNRKKYQLFHAHAYLGAIPAKIVSIFSGIPVVLTIHGTSLGKKDFLGKFQYLVEEVILTKIKYNAQISVGSDFLRFKNVNKNVSVIPTGFDVANFSKIKRKPFYNRILFVGRLHRQKSIDRLILSVAKLRKTFPDISLVIVGEGEEEEKLSSLVQSLHLQKKVIFKGRASGMGLSREYQKAGVFVLPSVYEGSPLTIFEAMAAGIPVIATKVGEIPFFIKDGKNGFLVSSNDQSALAEKIAFVLRLKNRDEIGLRGKEAVMKYSWDRMAAEVFKVYQKILS